MSILWISIVSLLVLTGVFLFAAFRPSIANRRQVAHDQVNLALTQSRLRELRDEEEQSLLSASGRVQAEREIKLALGHELSESVSEQDTKSNSGVLLSVFMTLVSVVLVMSYLKVNQVSVVTDWENAMIRLPELGKRIVMNADPSVTNDDLTDFAVGLRTRLHNKSDDAIGWLLLGRVNIALNQVSQGLQAYEKALALDPNHKGALTSYSQALVMRGQDADIKTALRLLSKVTATTPITDFDFWSLYGLVASLAKESDLAISVWRELEKSINPNDPRLNIVQQQLRGLLPQGPSVNVTVSLKYDLTLPPDGTVFVFVKGEKTGNLPLAVRKMPLKSFPLDITLSQSDAMMPSAMMREEMNVWVTARISSDPNIDLQIGDLQGQSTVIKLDPGETEVSVIIDTVIKSELNESK